MINVAGSLELGLGSLENVLDRSSLHDIALDLELTAHKELLRIGLATHQVGKVLVGKSQRDISTLLIALANSTGLLQVKVPGLSLLAGIDKLENNQSVGGLDGLLDQSRVGLEALINDVKNLGGGEVVCERVIISIKIEDEKKKEGNNLFSWVGNPPPFQKTTKEVICRYHHQSQS